jgi:hypothetical protein
LRAAGFRIANRKDRILEIAHIAVENQDGVGPANAASAPIPAVALALQRG